MIPVRDVIPARTRPGVTMALLVAQVAALAWPDVRQWWLPWCAHMLVLWLFGSTVEDRLGHGRFSLFCGLCAASAGAGTAAAGAAPSVPVAACGTVAGVSAAYFLMFPRSRVLVLVPVLVGIDVVDMPAWVVLGLWAVVQAAAASMPFPLNSEMDVLPAIAGAVAGAMSGGLAWLMLRRPERMRVDWWDSTSP